MPARLVIAPLEFVNGWTLAPTKWAYPKPGVEPNDTIRPPLGTWFWLISDSETISWPFSDVIPVKLTVDKPATVSAVIL